MKVVVVTHLSTHRKDLASLVQDFQVFVSSIAHHFMFVHIILDAGQEQLQWLH